MLVSFFLFGKKKKKISVRVNEDKMERGLVCSLVFISLNGGGGGGVRMTEGEVELTAT